MYVGVKWWSIKQIYKPSTISRKRSLRTVERNKMQCVRWTGHIQTAVQNEHNWNVSFQFVQCTVGLRSCRDCSSQQWCTYSYIWADSDEM